MRQISEEVYWVVLVEDGDTPKTVAHWIEDNLMPPLERGAVESDKWPVQPTPGQLIIFNAPDKRAMQRYPGEVRKLPKFMSVEEQEKIVENWIEDDREVGVHPVLLERLKELLNKWTRKE